MLTNTASDRVLKSSTSHVRMDLLAVSGGGTSEWGGRESYMAAHRLPVALDVGGGRVKMISEMGAWAFHCLPALVHHEDGV